MLHAFKLLFFAQFALGLPSLFNQIVVQTKPITTDTTRDKLIESKIIPEVLDDFEPSHSLELVYPDHESVGLGNFIPVEHVSQRPAFTFHHLGSPEFVEQRKSYTLILTDPDAKSNENPKWSEMCHWILANLTTTAVGQGMQANVIYAKEPMKLPGELLGYLPPSPPPKTGPHRYVFVLLEGSRGDLSIPPGRKHWGYHKQRHGIRDWAKENDLKIVGANFFYAANKKQ